jgi:hypothetical protein
MHPTGLGRLQRKTVTRWTTFLGKSDFLRVQTPQTNLDCRRSSRLCSASLRQEQEPLTQNLSRDSPAHDSAFSKVSACQPQFSGWKVGVLICAATAATICLLNITLTIWAVVNHNLVNGLSYLYTGSCTEVASLSRWIHLGINAMSTLLLSASNCGISMNPRSMIHTWLTHRRYYAGYQQPHSQRGRLGPSKIHVA